MKSIKKKIKRYFLADNFLTLDTYNLMYGYMGSIMYT